MPENRVSFQIRDLNGEYYAEPVNGEPCEIFGMSGFAYHQTPLDDLWRISHVETGVMVARSETRMGALMLAHEKAKTRRGLEAGIARVKALQPIQSGQGAPK